MSSRFTFRKFLKLVHEVGSIGLTGALVVQWLMLENMPPTAELVAYETARSQMAMVAQWVLFPSLALLLVSGLLAMAWTDAYTRAGWVWLKLALGVSVFEGTLIAIQGPARNEAALAAQALAGEVDPALLGATAAAEWKSTLVILGVAAINLVVSVWRPRFTGKSTARAAADDSGEGGLEGWPALSPPGAAEASSAAWPANTAATGGERRRETPASTERQPPGW